MALHGYGSFYRAGQKAQPGSMLLPWPFYGIEESASIG
jgi:hypothetical protein